MTAAGWSDDEVAGAVRAYMSGWFELLTDVTERLAARAGGLGEFEPRELATLVGVAFLGAEAMILLGFGEEQMPNRAALRKVGALIRAVIPSEEGKVSVIAERMVQGKLSDLTPGSFNIVLGKELALWAGVAVGDKVAQGAIIAPTQREGDGLLDHSRREAHPRSLRMQLSVTEH